MWRLLALGVLVAVVSGLGYGLLDRLAPGSDGLLAKAAGPFGASTSPASRFMTAPIARGHVRQPVTTTGTLQALVTVEVGTQLSGQVAEIFADFNDKVRQGQPLAQLDTKTFEARYAEASAATEMALAVVEVQRARVERAEIDARDAEAQRAVLQARIDNASVRLEAAQRALARTETLHARGAATLLQVEQGHSERDQAAASLREAAAIIAAHEHTIEGAKVDLKRAEAELVSALANVPQKQAVERATQIDLERTIIRSPIDGVVTGRNVDEGQTVAASLEAPVLFTIAGSLQEMEIHARVDEADVGRVKAGQQAVYTVDAYPGRHFKAEVTGVRKSPQVVHNVVTYTVVLATSNPESLLLPGMTATMRIVVHEVGPVLKLPLAALHFAPSAEPGALAAGDESEISEGPSGTVWRLAGDGGPEPVSVGLGADDGAYAAILDGSLNEGDEVIVGEAINAAPRRLFGIRLGF